MWLYQKEELSAPRPTASTQHTATGLSAQKTNPNTGEIDYTLAADTLEQTAQGDVLHGVTLEFTPSGKSYQLTATRAAFNQKTADFALTDGYQIIGDDIKMTGNQLSGNAKTQQVGSQTATKINKDGQTFNATGFEGDLKTGDYTFFAVEMVFAPAMRQDKKLF